LRGDLRVDLGRSLVGGGRATAAIRVVNGPEPKSPDLSEQGDTATETRKKTAAPRRFKVVFHNDDFTTMEFVIAVLRQFFHKNEAEAVHIMLTVHQKGKAVAGVFTRDVAETKVSEVMKHARERGMPLMLTTEPE
jgi:ATP-dependent Clp protease adaptor protein ClpS